MAWKAFFFSLFLLGGLGFSTPAFAQAQRCGSHTMPIGIPCPPFGLAESDPGRPAGWPDSEVARHYYVDNSVICTDSLNPYGWPSHPRCSFPIGSGSYPAGARVEVHGGPYTTPGSQFRTSFANCSAAQPCWFIGVGTAGNKTVTLPAQLGGQGVGCNRTVLNKTGCVEILDREWTIDGNYFVIEGFFLNGTTRSSIRPTTASTPHHFALRHLEIVNVNKTTGSCTNTGLSSNEVIFRNHLHDCGDHLAAALVETDVIGVQLGRSDRVWVLENEIYHNAGDGIALNAGQSNPNPRSRFSYIGRNHMWENGENAIDIKTAQDVIITSNVMHGYGASGGSDGTAIVVNDENATPEPGDWRLFIFNNIIYDSVVAVRAQSYANIFGNVMFHISSHCMLAFGGSSETWWENNTCADTGGALRRFGGSVGTAMRVRNNLFIDNVAPGLTTEVDNEAAIDPDTDIRNNQFSWSGGVYEWKGGLYTNLTAWEVASGGRAVENRIGAGGFLDEARHDYRLVLGAAAIDHGTSSLTSYDRFFALYGLRVNYDMNGTQRPVAGAWDIGAYEYAGTIGAIPNPPRNLRVVP